MIDIVDLDAIKVKSFDIKYFYIKIFCGYVGMMIYYRKQYFWYSSIFLEYKCFLELGTGA